MGCDHSTANDQKQSTNKNTDVNTTTEEKAPVESVIEVTGSTYVEGEPMDVKILTLGAGECGKSTIWRQLKMTYCGGFSQIEKNSMITTIRTNIISDIKDLVGVLSRTGQNVAPDLSGVVDTIAQLGGSADELDTDLANQIKDLWNDPAMKTIYQQANSIGLGDNTDHFLDSVTRIAAAGYVPTEEDIIKSRIRTTGSDNLAFMIKDKKTVLVDVGGQKSERRKWAGCFENVNFLMFVVSLSDFDQLMFEESETSRTKDSMDLFGNIANSARFAKTRIFLVLNKVDIFKRKLSESPEKFRAAYPGFQGSTSDVDACIEHVQKAFLSKLDANRSEDAWVKCIPACAMDRNNIKGLFQQVAKEVTA